MKKILLSIIVAITGLVFTACGSKAPFKSQEPLPEAALVYVYVVEGYNMSDEARHSEFSIHINGKRYLERIESGEHMVFNLKPNPTLMSAVKGQIIEEHLKLNLKAGEINYLRITENVPRGEFGFELVSPDIAREEIAKTGLAGSNMEDPNNIITEIIGSESEDDSIVKANGTAVPTLTEAQIDAIIEKKLSERTSVAPVQAPVQTAAPRYTSAPKVSKMDEIQRAFDMKNDGMLTEEEFKTIKAEILAK